MRKTLILVVALVAGCGGDALAPLRVPAEASVSFSNALGDTTLVALRDSVVASATLSYGCTGNVSARAAREGGTLVVTITDSLEFAVPCAFLAQYRTYRAAAGPLRSGTYVVELRFREVVATSVTTSTLARTTIIVR